MQSQQMKKVISTYKLLEKAWPFMCKNWNVAIKGKQHSSAEDQGSNEEWQSKPCNFQPSVSMFLIPGYSINTLISTSTQPSTGNFNTQGKAHLKSQEIVPGSFIQILLSATSSFWVK